MRALFYLFPMRMWSGYAFGLTSTNHFSPFRRANFFTSSICLTPSLRLSYGDCCAYSSLLLAWGCFSKYDTVHTEDRGSIPITDVRIGDSVLTDDNTYEVAYMLGHFSASQEADHTRIVTAEQNRSLETRRDHMVFNHRK